MTVWTVERDERGWSVVAEREGQRIEPRRSLTGLACITAQVIAAELNAAWMAGYRQGRDDVREIFAETLGD